MFNKKRTNTLLLLRNCASKNSLKTLFKAIAQAKISFKHLGPICLLHDVEYAVEQSDTDVFVIAVKFFGILAYVWDFQ